MSDKCILIGKVTSSHGVKGAVKIMSFAENPIDIFKYRIFDKNNNLINIKKIGTSNSINNNMFIAQIENINDRNESDKLKDLELFIKREELKDLKNDEFYINDLINMKVVSDSEEGIVKNVYNYGAGNILEIKWNNGKSDDVPFTKDYVKTVDKENKVIYIEKPVYI